MARRYGYYRKRNNNPIEQLFGIAALILLLTLWQWQKSDNNALLYLSIIAIILVGIVTYLAIHKYLQAQRRLRALDLAGIDIMDHLEFERYVALLLKNQGFDNIQLTEIYDYGVDIIARKDGITWGVQVKHYKYMVKAEAVRQVFTGLAHYKCDRAMVVTNNIFSRPATVLAADNNCVLIDRKELSDWIVQFQRI